MLVVYKAGHLTLDFGVKQCMRGAQLSSDASGVVNFKFTLAPPRNVRQRRRCNYAPECATSNTQPVPCCDSSQVTPGACARAVWQVPPRGIRSACFNYHAIHTAATKADMQISLTIVKLRRDAVRHLEATQETTKYVRQAAVMKRREHTQCTKYLSPKL